MTTWLDVLEGRADWCVLDGDSQAEPGGIFDMPEGSVDHVITDPPYEAQAHTKQRRVKRGSFGVVSEPLTFGAITAIERDTAAMLFARVAKRWVLAFCQAEAVDRWKASYEQAGLNWIRPMVWIKPQGPGSMPQLTGDRPAMGYESMALAHPPGRCRWNGGGKPGVYTYDKFSPYDQGEHPTQKPLRLMEQLLRDFTDRGDLILDAYCGSGTTGVACMRTGRRFIGWELDPEHAATARRRIGETREQLGLFGEVQP